MDTGSNILGVLELIGLGLISLGDGITRYTGAIMATLVGAFMDRLNRIRRFIDNSESNRPPR